MVWLVSYFFSGLLRIINKMALVGSVWGNYFVFYLLLIFYEGNFVSLCFRSFLFEVVGVIFV